MKIMINHTSMQPIYEQIVDQIKYQILHETLQGGEVLPSVRTLAKELQISALTVKKAYDYLDEAGMIVTVHGKGSFIAQTNQELIVEAGRREVEEALELAINKGKSCGMEKKELRELFELILEDLK